MAEKYKKEEASSEEKTAKETRSKEAAASEEVRSDTSDIITGDDDYSSLTTLSTDAVYKNPLNPKTRKNLLSQDLLTKTLQEKARLSATTGKRWISVQAFSYNAIQDYNYPVGAPTSYAEKGLIISTVKQPVGGSGYDPVSQVDDITPYPTSTWQGGLPPNDPSKLTIVYLSDKIELRYSYHAFNVIGGIYNYSGVNGHYPIKIRVTFASGHVEEFDIEAPVGKLYADYLQLFNGGLYTTQLIQEVQPCWTGFGGSYDWYSKGRNSLNTYLHMSADYNILTRFKPITATGQQELGLYRYYTGSGNPQWNLINPIDSIFNDPLALEYGVNGLVTPDKNNTARQVFVRLDVVGQGGTNHTHLIDNKDHSWFVSNYQTPTNITDYLVDDTATGTNPTGYDSLLYSITNANQIQMFTFTLYYSENITACGVSPVSTKYYVCADPNNPAYYETTALDCSNGIIPAADLPGGANYANVSFISSACCDPCRFEVTSITSSQASYGGTADGVVTWEIGQTAATQGNSWGSGSMYTIIITNTAGTVMGTSLPSGGNTTTDATVDTTNNSNTLTCNSSVVIKPGMQISGTNIPTGSYVENIVLGSVSIDVTSFTIVDSVGSPALCTGTATDITATLSGSYYGQHGALAANTTGNPYYTLCATDEDGCEDCVQFTVKESRIPPAGCTDSTAVNYDSSAVTDDGSCVLCQTATGLLTDPISGNTTSLFDSLVATSPQAATWGGSSHNSDGTFSVSASVVASMISYIDWDANTKFELLLYKTVSPGDASTATGAVQIGATINAGTLNNVSVAAYTWSSLAYGYYTVRARIVDSNSVSTMEDCWTEWFGVVQAEVCDDINNSTYTATPTDIALRLPTSSICTNYDCCELDALFLGPLVGGDPCDLYLTSSIECEPGRSVDVEWFYSTNGGAYSSLGFYSLGTVTSSQNIISSPVNNAASGNWVTVDGYYKVIITATHQSGDICIKEEILQVTLPITGCTDPTAHNYDPLATCPGPCAYPSWDCDLGTGTCTDPWTGTFAGYVPGAYNCLNGPGCCENDCIPPPVYGCMDPCATNYDALADTDDGSCTYTACTDPAALNTNQNCCNNNYYPSVSIIGTDNSCCNLPCSPGNKIDITTTNSTSTCTTFNLDGTVYIDFTIYSSAGSWTWEIQDNGGTPIYTDTTGGVNSDGTYYGTGTSQTYSLLGTGLYIVVVTDNLGCIWTKNFTINSTTSQVGCMNPAADNYDPNAICDCGCCEFCGCMDPNALNYDPSANTMCDCEYDTGTPNACVPQTLHDRIEMVQACLTIKGSDWLKDYKVGRADDCTLMNKWKLILIDYLLSQHKEGLDCLFNCADLNSPDAASLQDCNSIWSTGGPSTGPNHDPAHAGASVVNTGEGTTVTVYDGFPTGWFGYDVTQSPSSNKSFTGDVIKFDLPAGHPLATWLNGTVWTLTSLNAAGGTMHQGSHNEKLGHYTQCLDYNTLSVTTTVNYYDNFINFANKFCQDCNISILDNSTRNQNNTLLS